MPRYPPQYTSRPSIDAKTTPYDEVFEENSSSPGIAQPSALPYTQPRKTPQIDPISLPPQSADTITLLHRSPTTPPIHKTEGKRRSRSFTAPSLSRRHTVPVLALPVYGKCPKSPDLESTALGLTRQVLLEHFGNRVKEIQGGDGELNLDDAVSPEILPPQAIPHHLHRRHYSTTSLPPLFDQTHLTTPVHPRTLEREEPMSPLSQPSFLTPTRIAEEEDSPYIPRGYSPSPPCPHLHAMGSHSPLSTCEPMTPGSSKPRQPRTPLSDLDA